MPAISSTHKDVVAKLVPGGVSSLAHLSDQELLTSTRRLVGKSNQLFAALLLHLAEVEARGIHRARLCASLYTYCMYELRFSEDAAARRSSAARLVKQFPALLDAIANGELHLTGLLMIGPHLTPENHLEVLGRAKFRTKKELAKLVRELNPLPRVPDLIEPLRPAPLVLPTTRPSWAKFVASWEGPVRELPDGERPEKWANDGHDDGDASPSMLPDAPARCEATQGESRSQPSQGGAPKVEPSVDSDRHLAVQSDGLSPLPLDLPPIAGPQQYQMQFTTSEEHVQLVERAKALLARSKPGVTLGELHFEAMRLLVASLEKRKFAVTDRPRKRAVSRLAPERAISPSKSGPALDDAGTAEPIETVAPPPASVTPPEPEPVTPLAPAPRRRGRYVPAAERREVFTRDEARCTFTDEQGQRCGETRYLELHHLKPFAHGGENVASNLTLRCSAHNALAAEQDFGREVIEQKRDSTRHESLAAQSRPRRDFAS